MKSDMVVISWWSNCLGLTCLRNLALYAPHRTIYVIQVGKTEGGKERFRAHMPPGVIELSYPADRPAEDWRVREAVARELLGDREGLWFIDHDLFILEDCTGWLDDMDRHFARSNVCLCHPVPRRGPAITNPAFWLSPVRFPPGMPGFARLPYQEEPVVTRPFALRQSAALMMPEKDTLVAAMEFLQPWGMVCGFPLADPDRVPGGLPPFPRCEHIGGLYTFTGELPSEPHDWVSRCVDRFTAFYSTCPRAWVEAEDPVLLARLAEFREARNKSSRRGLAFTCSRRDFWPALLQELRVIYGSVKGGQGGQLSQLRELPDDQLARIRPILNPEYEIFVDQDYICCRARETEIARKLFQMKRESLATFNQFTGQHNLAEIGARLAKQMGWDEARGFAYARDLFLDLVDRLVCVPRDPPDLADLLAE